MRAERATKSREVSSAPWWQFWRIRNELYRAIENKERVIARSRVSNLNSMVFVPTNLILADSLVILALDRWGDFAFLQSTIHDAWINIYGSSMRTDLRYTSSTCFETFPFARSNRLLEGVGQRYHQVREELMLDRDQGLTKISNSFHQSANCSPDIVKLRALQVEMDNAVAAAYGWSDLDFGHGFHKTKQGLRYTISEVARLEVLDRLLALNHARNAEEEASAPPVKPKRAGKKKSAGQNALF